MSEPFLAEIRIFAGNFAPRGWAFCNGQLLPIAQNTALFSLIGTTYGGDGRTTTQLPNLEGRAPMHPGRGPGLTARRLGEKTGVETVTLTEQQMPSHQHRVEAVQPSQFTIGDNLSPAGNYFARPQTGNAYVDAGAQQAMAPQAIAQNGGSQAHTNMQPFLTLNFIIALVGLYPSRG
ncbi:MAG: phage tail protein [Ilumatobacter sp.]|nr:phage tail protein [Ilumatobacter sp.]